jgi:hypothetical protein
VRRAQRPLEPTRPFARAVADAVAGAGLQVGLHGAPLADAFRTRAALQRPKALDLPVASALEAGGVKLVPVCSASARR